MIRSQDENLSCFSLLFSLILYKGWFSVCKNHDKSKITQKLSRIKEIIFFSLQFKFNQELYGYIYSVLVCSQELKFLTPAATSKKWPSLRFQSRCGSALKGGERKHAAHLPLLILITLLLNGSGMCVGNGPGGWRHRARREDEGRGSTWRKHTRDRQTRRTLGRRHENDI